MYTEHFGLTKHPFGLTPDPAFLFLTRQHREGLAGLAYSILERKGFLLLTGAAGSGKTTLLAWLLEKLPPGRVSSSVILNPLLTPAEFFELVLLNFGVAHVPDSKARRLQILRNLLDEGAAEDRINVLIVDEAHKLDAGLLEEVRLLGNFQSTGCALLQILLIGQNDLDEILCRPGLWQFKQRIAVRLELQPLTPSEVQIYIQHRWRTAGGSLPVPLAADAVAAVTDLSGGTPRLVNSLCDNALMLAFAEDQRQVTAAHIRMAAADLRLTPLPLPPPASLPPLQDLPMLRMIGTRVEPKPRKASPRSRWAAKLGLA